jgi:amino-acid N-acetyltransferase
MTSAPIAIDPADPADLPAVLRLLDARGLPVDGVADLGASMVVARRGGAVVGVAGIELYADGALLRSVAVDASMQGRGLGRRLTESALALADAHAAPAVYLLTTTADGFFPRFGFETVGRDEVPASVQASVEFRSACPASATVMRRRRPS